MRYTPGYDPIQVMWDRDMKMERDHFGRKQINWIYLSSWVKNCDSEGHLTMRSCLIGAVINSSRSIGHQTEILKTVPS